MLSKKGQALVEFVILLPIIMMILFIIIDFANVFYQKNHLESISNDVVALVKNNSSVSSIEETEKIKISTEHISNTTEIEIKKDINLITPFSNLFFKSPFTISTERVIINE